MCLMDFINKQLNHVYYVMRKIKTINYLLARVAIVLCAFLLFPSFSHAGDYSIKVGETRKIYCTASAPSNGYVTHTFYELVDPNDAKYIMINYTSSEMCVEVTGLSAKSSIKIAVTYAYSYRGSYDDKIHVGHGTYYDYITVVGGAAATKISFNPSNPKIKVGESVQLKVELTPSNSSTSWEWGVVETLTLPSAYETSVEGNVITVKAKKAMTLYLIAQTTNGLKATCVVTATNEGNENAPKPTGIKLSTNKLSMIQGNQQKINYTLTPSDASTIISWKSSDENIASVSGNGLISALKPGTTTISATTSNGIEASLTLSVMPCATAVSLPGHVNVKLGYSYVIKPVFSPSGATSDCTWTSSNTSIAVVSGGKITGKQEGNATITVRTKDGLTSSSQVSVSKPTEDMDYRNTGAKISKIQDIVYRHFIK